jgi:CRISPR/Cas system CMR subunit Cmr4 (Cas7 group RAMP superfamily)
MALLKEFERQPMDKDIIDSLRAVNMDFIWGESREIFNLANEPDSVRERYGKSRLGQSCLTARRLVEAGVPFINVRTTGWDTHKKHFQHMNTMLPDLDKALSALLEDLDDKVRIQLFGSDKKNNNGVSAKGQAIFYDAQLLYLPVQTDNLFDYATCQGVIDIMNSRRMMFELNETPEFELNGREVQTMDSKAFSELCNNDNLPIIARNALGVNTNLWYEQVVPSETIFYAIIQEPNSTLKDCMNGKIIQIGANATIGYGYCEFRCIAESTKSSSDGN